MRRRQNQPLIQKPVANPLQNEPCHEKIFGFFDQVRHKPAYSADETSWCLEIPAIASGGIILSSRATEILKSKSVRSTNDVIDVIGTCVRQSQIVTKTNDSSFSSKSVSEIGYFSNTLWSLNC